MVGNWLCWLLAGKSDLKQTMISSIVLVRAWLDLYLPFFIYTFFLFPLPKTNMIHSYHTVSIIGVDDGWKFTVTKKI